jgi:hypothetical protein
MRRKGLLSLRDWNLASGILAFIYPQKLEAALQVIQRNHIRHTRRLEIVGKISRFFAFWMSWTFKLIAETKLISRGSERVCGD